MFSVYLNDFIYDHSLYEQLIFNLSKTKNYIVEATFFGLKQMLPCQMRTRVQNH